MTVELGAWGTVTCWHIIVHFDSLFGCVLQRVYSLSRVLYEILFGISYNMYSTTCELVCTKMLEIDLLKQFLKV